MVLLHLLQHLFFTSGREAARGGGLVTAGVATMGKYEQAWLGTGGDIAELACGDMVGSAVRLPMRGDEIEAGEGVGLRDQIVAATAILDDALSRAGIAGIHDHSSMCFDPIPESLPPLAMLYQERF